jgi:peptidyl-prolyl cis-trans isomerase SurA
MRLKFIVSAFLMTLMIRVEAQEGVIIDQIIAKVDNYIIMKSDLEKAYLEYLSRGEFNTGQARCQILENLVVNKMLVAKAEIDSVVVADAEVQGNLQQRMNYMISQIGSRDEIEKFYGKSMEQIENELFESVKEQMLIDRMQREITASVTVTPSEVKRFFDNIPRDSLPYFSTEVEVAQIVLKPEAGKKRLNYVRSQLLDLRERIVSGESFERLAKIYSEDPGSAARGGELPFYRRGELAPEYEATAMTLEKGELSMPVKTDFGYHIIELLEKRGNTYKSRHILIIPKPSPSDILKTEMKLDSIRTLILNDSIDFQSAAKDFSDDEATASNGGFFTDPSGANRISVDELDPNIFFTIDTMEIGNITKPIRFSMPDGTAAYRIIYYKSRVPPHQANLKMDYQKIAQAALNEKQSRLLNQWFEEARSDVYIEIDPAYDECNIEN